jgi:hypothetical protein
VAQQSHAGRTRDTGKPAPALRPRQPHGVAAQDLVFLARRQVSSVVREPSIKVFLNHAQMDHETVHIDFKRARNLEPPHSRFDFGGAGLNLGNSRPVGALRKLAFKVSESAVELIDTTNIQPSVKRTREANDGNQHRDDRNDKECNSIEKRVKPERCVPLPYESDSWIAPRVPVRRLTGGRTRHEKCGII